MRRMTRSGATLLGVATVSLGVVATLLAREAANPTERHDVELLGPAAVHAFLATAEQAVPSPDGSKAFIGSNCVDLTFPHGQTQCNWSLLLADGSKSSYSGWNGDAVYLAWSANSSAFAAERSDGSLLVGSVDGAVPLVLPDRLITPALSPSGRLVAGEILGGSPDIMEALAQSPGLGLYEVQTGSRVAILPSKDGDRFAPFFIDEVQLGFGDLVGDGDRVASLFAWNTDTMDVRQLTNVFGGPIVPFPSSPPLTSDGKLVFEATTSGGEPMIYSVNLATLETSKVGVGTLPVLEGGAIRAIRQPVGSKGGD